MSSQILPGQELCSDCARGADGQLHCRAALLSATHHSGLLDSSGFSRTLMLTAWGHISRHYQGKHLLKNVLRWDNEVVQLCKLSLCQVSSLHRAVKRLTTCPPTLPWCTTKAPSQLWSNITLCKEETIQNQGGIAFLFFGSSPVPVKFLLQPFFLCTPLQTATLQQHLGSRLPLASSAHTETEKAPIQGTHQCPILLYSPQARGDHIADSTSAQLCCGSGVGHRRDLLSFPPLA